MSTQAERPHNMNEETEVNEKGAAQSKLNLAMDLIPAEALLRLGEITYAGAGKYARNNWRGIPFRDHINHALAHIALYMNGDRADDHIGHALCRMAFAVAMQDAEGEYDFKAFEALPNADA